MNLNISHWSALCTRDTCKNIVSKYNIPWMTLWSANLYIRPPPMSLYLKWRDIAWRAKIVYGVAAPGPARELKRVITNCKWSQYRLYLASTCTIDHTFKVTKIIFSGGWIRQSLPFRTWSTAKWSVTLRHTLWSIKSRSCSLRWHYL